MPNNPPLCPTVFFNLECTQPNLTGKRHGGGLYGEIVLRRIVNRELPVVAFHDSAKWLNPGISALARSHPAFKLVDRREADLSELFEHSGAATVFSPLYQADVSALPSHRNITVVHGLRNLELPVDAQAWRYPGNRNPGALARFLACRLMPGFMLRRGRRRATAAMQHEFVVVSNHSANAVKVWLPGFREHDIKVFYSPSTVSANATPATPAGEKYLLMVSGNRWEKNAIRAIQALETLFDGGHLPEWKVKITGLQRLTDLYIRFRHPARFEALGYVDDDALDKLYAGAWAFLYPSLNEGFGYPPLEAMARGVPVAASAVCSIPEVCGQAVLYFNPRDRAEIANRLLQLDDVQTRNRLIAAGLERSEQIRARQDADLDRLVDFLYGM